MTHILAAVRKALRDFADPVCQDWGSVHYDYYREYMVRLVPVADPNEPSRIARWVPDPDRQKNIDDLIAAHEAEERRKEAERHKPQNRTSESSTPEPVTPGFNPVDIPGL